MRLTDLVSALDNELSSANITDYCPNGLQVEGRPSVTKIVTGVTASLALIEKAVCLGADAIIVHHGYFWKGEKQAIVGMKKQRIQMLLANGISLISYHLPLDVHPTLGNNAQMGKRLNIQNIRTLDHIKPHGIVMAGSLVSPMSHSTFSEFVSGVFQRHVVSVGDKCSINTVAWCTGGGQNFIDETVAQQVDGNAIDAFISGEISEQTTHSAREQNIDYFAAGHHATERYGVRALGNWLHEHYALDVEFIDIDNPA